MTCSCGVTHAPWWGRYVQPPSCTLTAQDRAFADFLAFGWQR